MGRKRRLGGDRKKISWPRKVVTLAILCFLLFFWYGVLTSLAPSEDFFELGKGQSLYEKLVTLVGVVTSYPLQTFLLVASLFTMMLITSYLIFLTLCLLLSVVIGWPIFYPGLIVFGENVFLNVHGRRDEWIKEKFWVDKKADS